VPAPQPLRSDVALGIVRLVVGSLFLAAGVGKLAIPAWRGRWGSLLAAAGLPLPEVSRWLGPAAEIVAGALLVAGYLVRPAAAGAAAMMGLALVVHARAGAAEEAGLPLLASLCAAMALVVLWGGAGAWAAGRRSSTPAPR
jgi:uncharacterized membrane protein YphA (DoxX/SURF4 family)